MPLARINSPTALLNCAGDSGNLILRKSAPAISRSACNSHRKICPLATSIVSNSPSPYRNDRSNTETIACSSGTNRPLRYTSIAWAAKRQRPDKPQGFGHRFVIFGFRVGVRDNSRPDLEMSASLFEQSRTNDDGQLGLPVKADISEGARIRSPAHELQLFDNFHGPDFGRPCNAAAGETSCQRAKMRHVRPQRAFNDRNKVLDLGKSLQPGEVGNLNRTKFAHLSQIVSQQVGYHDQLGHLLGASAQLIA